MTIQPISGGVAPLYSAVTPSFRTVCSKQSNGPVNRELFVVCSRTLIVSNLQPSTSSTRFMSGVFLWSYVRMADCDVRLLAMMAALSGTARPARLTCQLRYA